MNRQQVAQQSTANRKNTLETTMLSSSNDEIQLEGSMTSIHGTFVRQHTNGKWKDILEFICSESSIMFYSNVFLIIWSIILMFTSDKYTSNLDTTRTFLNLESNKTIIYSLYSGFIMLLLCIGGLYGALTIRRTLCYCMSGMMIFDALFQFGLGLTIINRKADQEIMVKKEMKSNFLSYGIQSDITQRWNRFQSEFSCCGLYGRNSYKAKQLLVPESCSPDQYDQNNDRETRFHVGCFNVVKKLEAKFLNPVIILTLFCSFLQMSNAILTLNLLRPKPKPRRYHIAYIKT